MRVAYLLTGSNEAAEDAVQETFIRCRTKLADLDHPRSYLRAALVNECRSLHRRSHRESAFMREPEPPLATDLIELQDALARLPARRHRPAIVTLLATAACVAAAVLITVAVTRRSDSVRTRVRVVGGDVPGVSLPAPPTEPAGPAVHTLEIDARNFQFQGHHFDVPAGITDVRLVRREGTHGLGSDAPELTYLDLVALPPRDAAKVDFVSRGSVKVDFVEGRTYTIFCTIPGHRASGMEATISVGPPDSQMVTTATTMPASAIGR